MRAETNRKRSFQYLALPNRLLSSEKIVKGEGENKILKLVSDTFYLEPTPISFKDKENIVPLDFTRQEICTLEQKNKKKTLWPILPFQVLLGQKLCSRTEGISKYDDSHRPTIK
ncbi:hypothetical protein [Barnesiella sp. An22]|uniref:hypothetical protein n=2 Tax=Barnesiella TaxID=397864 RepID=UPI00320B2EE4